MRPVLFLYLILLVSLTLAPAFHVIEKAGIVAAQLHAKGGR